MFCRNEARFIFFTYQNIPFWCVKEITRGDISFTHQKHMFLWTNIKRFINWTSYLNPVCPQFILNKRVYRKIGVQILEALISCNFTTSLCRGPIAQLVASLIADPGIMCLTLAWPQEIFYWHSPPSADSRRAVVSYKRKYVL